MNVLILSASVGSGHLRAAQAVEAAFAELYPRARVTNLDVLALANPGFRKLYGDGYLRMAASAPHLLGYLYDATDRGPEPMPVGDGVRRFLQKLSLRAFPGLIEEGAFDVVVNTHFLPAELVAELKRAGRADVPQLTVVTDFEAHGLWAHLPCERFAVATAQAAAALRCRGARPEQIAVTGIPIHPVFSRLPRRSEARRALGLSGERPVVVQLAGGAGMGPLEDIFEQLLGVAPECELVVVTGRNEEARRRLCLRAESARHRAHVLGYTDRMHELMTAADLVVTKPGGLTTSEALACRAPLVVVNPIPGQETRNADFVLENGAGIKANSLAGLGAKISALLAEPQRLDAMRARATLLGRPLAAFEVARMAAELALSTRAAAASPVHPARPWGPATAARPADAISPR